MMTKPTTTISPPPPSDFVFDIENDSFSCFARRLESDFPFLRVTKVDVAGDTVLSSDHGGMRILCLYRGEGEVFLPKNYRTQEGDGQPLPADQYCPDPIDPQFAETLRRIRRGLDTVSATARPPIDAVLRRWNESGQIFCGDISGELWRLLEQTKRPWSTDLDTGSTDTEGAIEELFRCHRDVGFSTKTVDSWEHLMAGDQLIVTENEPLQVRGDFRCFSLENIERTQSHVSAVRRLRFLLDTAGGCSPGFDPFRRLPITWFPVPLDEVGDGVDSGDGGDGINFFNNHVVNIPAENSPTHFHPYNPIGGGTPQTEFYLVLDPAAYNLATAGLTPEIILYPNLADLTRYERIALRPGMIVYMPPCTGHRGLNVFALIMTVPGFKPGNELYLDRDIFEQTGGTALYNETHLNSKNFERLEDFYVPTHRGVGTVR